MLVLTKGSWWRRYAVALRYSSPEYFRALNGAVAYAAFMENADIYIWNHLHRNWYKVMTINNRNN